MRLVLCLPALLLVGACADRPSESRGQTALEGQVDGGQATRLRIVSFTKTDGQSSELAGVKLYRMAFRATARFAEDAYSDAAGSIFDVLKSNSTITTFAITNRHPGCPNDAPCMRFAPDPARAAKGDELALAGTIQFEKSEQGWHPNGVSFSVAKVTTRDASTVRGGASSPSAAASTADGDSAPLQPQSGDAVSNASNQRCAAFSAEHPLPRLPWYQRILGKRSSVAASMPDSIVKLNPANASVGTVSFLTTGELCVGATAVAFAPGIKLPFILQPPVDRFSAVLSRPSALGFRVMSISYDSRPKRSWVIHPDSTLAVSQELTAPGTFDQESVAWSANGLRAVMAVYPQFSTGPYMRIVAYDIPTRVAASLEMDAPELKPCGLGLRPDYRSWHWLAADVVEVRVGLWRLSLQSSCFPDDSIRTMRFDFSSRTSSRVR